MSENADQIWKNAMHALFRSMVSFYFPELDARIDWNRGYTFCEQELECLVTPEPSNRGYVDVLAKVSLLDGTDTCILLHVEIQGYGSGEAAMLDFEKRMFMYFYRIRDKWDLDVVTLAVLTDGNRKYRPDRYEYSLHGTTLVYVFNVVKVIDYDDEELERNPNPFATLMLAAKRALKAQRSDDETKALVKTSFVRMMFAKGHGKEEIRAIFEFIEWSVRIVDVENVEKYIAEIRTIANKEGEEMTFLGDFARGVIAEKEKEAEKALLDMKREHEKALLMVEEHEKALREAERECAEARRLAEEMKAEAEKARLEEREKAEKARLEEREKAEKAHLEEREKAEQARLELERTLLSQAAEMLDGGEPEEKILRYTRISREELDRLIDSRRR